MGLNAIEVLSPNTWSTVARQLKLSGREEQIARLILLDERVSVIALELGLSRHTMHSYLGRVYRKLGVNSSCQLAVTVLTACIQLEQRDGACDSTCRGWESQDFVRSLSSRPAGADVAYVDVD